MHLILGGWRRVAQVPIVFNNSKLGAPGPLQLGTRDSTKHIPRMPGPNPSARLP